MVKVRVRLWQGSATGGPQAMTGLWAKKKEGKIQSNTSCHIIVEKEEVCVQPL